MISLYVDKYLSITMPVLTQFCHSQTAKVTHFTLLFCHLPDKFDRLVISKTT
ncbi:hypothetical protein JCM19240_2925 [Vibrio maritimus]|uniref:Uncharacterized protein n=1 Tax=Vibrio maritimus TaxID=990268 RepID=A0A090TDR1_9VIBR|nr:hypothetical protein JCM19240_2925 [Vibrio maritimus]